MTLLRTTAVLATLAAMSVSTAFAHGASHPPQVRSQASASYASSFAQPGHGEAGIAVYGSDGRVIGQDPDANVRLQLLRDQATFTR